jgi:hypothetical protein
VVARSKGRKSPSIVNHCWFDPHEEYFVEGFAILKVHAGISISNYNYDYFGAALEARE